MIDEETKEIFNKMERESELMALLSSAIPELLIVNQWKIYVFFLKKCQTSLNEILDNIKRHGLTKEYLIASVKESRFYLFNFYAYVYSIRQTMYNGKDFSKGGEEYDRVITDWKKSPIVRIAIGIRNKYQHGSLMEHCLHYEDRTSHHPNGLGSSAWYNFELSTWKKIIDEVEGSEAKHYLRSILKPSVTSPITRINDEFITSCDNVSKRIEEIFDRTFIEELKAKKAITDELDILEKWFEKHGLYLFENAI